MAPVATRLIIGLTLINCVVNCSEIGIGNSTEIPQKTFEDAEKEVIGFVNDQLRSILPKVVGGAGASTLSPRCQAGMMKIFGNIRRLKGWTIKMMDSMGKPTAGILKGTTYSMGHYDQCVDLAISNKGFETHNTGEAMFQGMYCKVRIGFDQVVIDTARRYQKGELNETELGRLKEIIQDTPYLPVTSEYMSHFVGLCFPSICTLEDVQELLGIISFPGKASVERCEVKVEKELSSTQIIIFALFLLIVSLVLISTFIHWLFHQKVEDILTGYGDKRCVAVSISFSLCNNTRHLMKNIKDDTDSVLSGHSVRGIVVASVAWMTLGHTYLFPYDAYYMQASSIENLRGYLTDSYFAVIVSSPLAVDALLVCCGFILTYSLWYYACKADEVKVNVFRLIFCNYLRIAIPALLCLGVVVLFSAFGSGPFWRDFMDETTTKCERYAWSQLGMYSNFLDRNQQCFPHLWFASCLAQLTLAGIILSWILSKSVKFGTLLTLVLSVAANVTVGILTFKNSLPPAYVAYFNDRSSNFFWQINFSLPLSHFGPYGLGMLAGIFVARRSSHKLSTFISIAGWTLCLCVLQGIFMFIHKYNMESMGEFWSATYAASHRTLFAMCVVWIIVSCSFGNGGFVNSILSSRLFDPLFKLSYYGYIFHFVIIFFASALARDHFYYTHMELIFRAISYIVITYFASYLLYLIFEMPLKSLCYALCPKRSSQINVTSLGNCGQRNGDITTANCAVSGDCKLWSVTNSKMSVP